MKDFQTGN